MIFFISPLRAASLAASHVERGTAHHVPSSFPQGCVPVSFLCPCTCLPEGRIPSLRPETHIHLGASLQPLLEGVVSRDMSRAKRATLRPNLDILQRKHVVRDPLVLQSSIAPCSGRRAVAIWRRYHEQHLRFLVFFEWATSMFMSPLKLAPCQCVGKFLSSD